MTASGQLLSFVMASVLGSVAIGAGHPAFQTAEGPSARIEGTRGRTILSEGQEAACGYEGAQVKDAQPGESRAAGKPFTPTEARPWSTVESSIAERTDGPARSAIASFSPSGSADSVPSTCPKDMAEVLGEHCQIVEQICVEYISEKKDRCAKYRNQVRCFGKTTTVHVCVDRYEYPNLAGAKPTVAVSFDDASKLCAAEGKRLCTADEWTQACEGPDHAPYAYGFARDPNACNHDKPYIEPDAFAYQNPETRAAEVARLNQSEPSGSRRGCVSAYGVYDLTGNVDEWVKNGASSMSGPESQSGLKGGYWGPVRNRCRPTTTDHNHWHHGYQIGFRCCKDANATGSAPPALNETDDNSAPVSDSAPEARAEVIRS